MTDDLRALSDAATPGKWTNFLPLYGLYLHGFDAAYAVALVNAHRAGEAEGDGDPFDITLTTEHSTRERDWELAAISARQETAIAVAENARLRAQVAAVKALCWDAHEQYVYAPTLRSALAGATTEPARDLPGNAGEGNAHENRERRPVSEGTQPRPSHESRGERPDQTGGDRGDGGQVRRPPERRTAVVHGPGAAEPPARPASSAALAGDDQ